MPRLSPLKFRALIKALRGHDKQFTVLESSRGKGSERMIFHPDIEGRAECYPVKCHGEGDEIPVGTLKAIIRRFKLPKGVL